ncbi:MAG TPA: IS110 family transposase [Amaricoccus sp.]|uniref:IS110 family transposase n=1 Tax=Amaricoccus sp. TaxID=1872485 RepID=UPI001DFAE664|nr:IS110 family transposase [Amaricoccus sp.]MCB1401925.1 IS110 family transposase [Paracoccaceae bacterium]HPG23243.1 IS110 family transposase [Amaricoccus sp.]HRW16672.1 IS110 family transposase [Amaricoccus sp.]
MPRNCIGVDVAKDWIDVFHPVDGAARLASDPGTLRAFARRVARERRLVVFEASGGYDRPLAEALRNVGAGYCRVNPGQARHFARALGVLGKTDRVDARLLAEMGARLELAATPSPAPVQRALKAQAARRRQLVEMRKQERTRLRQAAGRAERRSLERHLRWLDGEITRIEAALDETLAADAPAARVLARLCTAPGVGRVLATTLVAELPELGARDRRRIAAMAGIAPVARDSGKRSPARSIGGGRPVVRSALYLAALSASRFDPGLASFRNRLERRGRTPKQAIIAVARKLLTILNAMIRDGTDCRPA